MQLIPENTSRKVDQLGRITLPKGLRDRLNLTEGTELELSMGYENDNSYIILQCPVNKTAQARAAAKILCDLGLSDEIPMLDSIAFGDFEIAEEDTAK